MHVLSRRSYTTSKEALLALNAEPGKDYAKKYHIQMN